MKRLSRFSSVVAAGCALAIASLVPWFASCATTEEGVEGAPEGSALPPIDGAVDTNVDLDAGPDAPCDPNDPSCVTKPITCDEADWCPVAAPVQNFVALVSVWGASANDVWTVGSGGTVLHWNGTAWTATPTNRKDTFRAVWGTSANEIFTASSTDVIMRSTGVSASGSATWTALPEVTTGYDPSGSVFCMWGSAPGDLRIGSRPFYVTLPSGDQTTMNILTKVPADCGVGWATNEGTATVRGIWGASGDDLWVVGDNSDFVKYQLGYTAHGRRTDASKPYTWTQVDSQSGVTLEAIWGSGANDIWAVGGTGNIRHVSAAAPQWDIVESPTTQDLHRIWGSGANDIWAVGDDATILHYDGAKWTSSVPSLPVGKKRPALYGVWGSGSKDVWIVGDGIILRYTGKKSGGGK